MSNGGMGGTKDRADRLKHRKPGQWSSVSSDFLYLASKLYKLSEKEVSTSIEGGTSKMVFAGIPVLLSSLSALIIECEHIGVLTPPELDMKQPLPQLLKQRYGMSGELLKDFECLCEIRNEIVHPVPLPTGTKDGWPEYLRRVKDKLIAVEQPGGLFAQLASHDLFTWALMVTQAAHKVVIYSFPHHGEMLQFFLTTFANFAPDPAPPAPRP